MIFGLNFNGKQIPDGWKRRFAKECKVAWYEPRAKFVLQGVATDLESLWHMLEQANNGRRNMHVEERHSAAGLVYGVYTY